MQASDLNTDNLNPKRKKNKELVGNAYTTFFFFMGLRRNHSEALLLRLALEFSLALVFPCPDPPEAQAASA